MTADGGPGAPAKALASVCLFCGSSNGDPPSYMAAAAAFGARLAEENLRLVYGGGGIGLMGAAAKSAHAAGGRVLGVMPEFLRRHEVLYDAVETIIVANMHDRKRLMFENADAFAVFPGGIGTLEEVVELMSWRRLDLHRKPIVFLDLGGFWQPLFHLMEHAVAHRFAPAWIKDTWASVSEVEEVIPAIRRLLPVAAQGPGLFGYAHGDGDLSDRF
jgi:uncharacterized protein (TIGR00730 family)